MISKKTGYKNFYLLNIVAIFVVLFAGFILADHSSSADLRPEWSPANSNVDYNVTFCKTSGDSINEVRIYKNFDGSIFYSNFQCEEKDGWELLYIGTYPACFYVAKDSSHYLDDDGDCETFYFSATSPEANESMCDLTWRFETRDTQDFWQYLYDTTSVDDVSPKIIKYLGKPKKVSDGMTWITQDTPITIEAYDRGNCAISGLDYCEYRYDVDGQEVLPWTKIEWDSSDEINGVMHYFFTFKYKEDSVHHLEIRCYDIAGNMEYHEQTDKVDSTPPETTKTYGSPFFTDGTYDWITSDTSITLNVVDGGEICDIGVKNLSYRINLLDIPDEECVAECNFEGSGAWTTVNSDSVEFNIPEESCHLIEFYSTDEIGNKEQVKRQCVFVDNTKPIAKAYTGKPNVDCEGGAWCDYYVRDHVAPITLKCFPGFEEPHPSPLDKIYWRYKVDEGDWTDWNEADASQGAEIIFEEDSNHTLEYKCTDKLGHESKILVKKYKVDSQPPIIEKSMIGTGGVDYIGDCPPQSEEDVCYVRSNNSAGVGGVKVNVYDDPKYGCAVDDVLCNYNILWGEGKSESECNSLGYGYYGMWNGASWCVIDSGEFGEGSTDFFFNEDSKHILSLSCSDALGNNVSDVESFLVDITPPTTVKTYDESKSIVKNGYRWILPETDISLSSSDEKVGVDKIYYRVTYLGDKFCPEACQETGSGNWTEVNSDSTIFNIPEESCHLIEFYAVDKLGNKEDIKSQCVMVDGSAPEVAKIIGEPKVYDCKSDLQNPGFETGDLSSWNLDFDNDSVSVIPQDYYLKPIFGNYMLRLGDDNGGIGGDQPIGRNQVSQEFIATQDMLSFAYNIFTFDYEGYNHFGYKLIDLDDDSVIYDYEQGAWGDYEGLKSTGWQFANLDISNYLGKNLKLIIYSGGTEDSSYSTWTYVDFYCNRTFVSQQTPITLTCEDSLPHPVGDVTIWYRYKVSENCDDLENNENWLPLEENCEGTFKDGWCDSACNDLTRKTIYFPEDSCHELEYYCEDALGNKGKTLREIDIVDSQAPEINLEVIGPQAGDCTFEGELENCYTDSATVIKITSQDPEPHPVGDVDCKITVYWLDISSQDCLEHNGFIDDSGKCVVLSDDFSDEYEFSFQEESKHELEVNCKDALGNSNSLSRVFFVDKTPPSIAKKYGEPYFTNKELEPANLSSWWAEWISSDTQIHFSINDAGPHKTGIKEVKYRVTKVDDEQCRNYYNNPRETDYSCDEEEGSGDWTYVNVEDPSSVGFDFNIPEESCHLIEVEAKDNVDKCNLHKQWVYVDNSAPLPNKTVGKPGTPWDGSDANFYNLSEFCSEEGKCWKVTTMTPITLGCIDQEPHPVNHEEIYFRVGLDGDDYTKVYCDRINGGIFNESGDGYCYVSGTEAPINFYFTEESEHNLAYYCKDVLGNKGPVDDEKFKVEGVSFNITLNKKWNLISVPVRLLDDSMDSAFSDIADKVKAVWSYDSVNDEWHVYTPDGDSSNDDLNTMVPGEGYWVLNNEPAQLIIGGSLMSPAMTPPSKQIVNGWNLVGYYGTEGLTEYSGPNGNGMPANCVFNTLGESIFDKSFASLWGYWEPYNPNAWIGFSGSDNLDPGAGYWLFYSGEEGSYSPSTTCNWWIT